jgi:hypothetical protein
MVACVTDLADKSFADAVTLWQRFVTTFREDQDLLVKEFADRSKGYNFRPIVSNYQGNPQAVITHPKGEAQQYAR